jgi:hypothetical protein
MNQGYGYENFVCDNCDSSLYFPGEPCVECGGTMRKLDAKEIARRQEVAKAHKRRRAQLDGVREATDRANKASINEHALRKRHEQEVAEKANAEYEAELRNWVEVSFQKLRPYQVGTPRKKDVKQVRRLLSEAYACYTPSVSKHERREKRKKRERLWRNIRNWLRSSVEPNKLEAVVTGDDD